MKDFIIRLLTNTSKIDHNQNLEVKLAESYEEYLKAFSLLHDAYVAKGLMEKHPSGLRCNVHSFLPHNSVVVVIDKEVNEVVGTVSLILDTVLGLPAEKAYVAEVEKIRKIKKNKMVEVSALAVDPKYRHQSHVIQFMLNKFLYQFCKQNLGVDMLIIVVHPKAELFYRALMGFEPLGEVIEYDFVKGALARFLYLDFSGDFEKKLRARYLILKNSFFDYVVNREDARVKLKQYFKSNILLRDKMTMEKLMAKVNFDITSLSELEQKQIISSLGVNNIKQCEIRGIDYRYEVFIDSYVVFSDIKMETNIINISNKGAFIQCNPSMLKVGMMGEMLFQLNNLTNIVNFEIKWINNNVASKLPMGVGVYFYNQSFKLNKDIAA